MLGTFLLYTYWCLFTSHSPECVHACMCLCGCALAMCAFARRQFTRFFSHYYFSFSFALAYACFSFWYGGWVLLGVCECFFLLIFSHHLRKPFSIRPLWLVSAPAQTKTQAAKWQMVVRDKKKQIHDESSFHILCRLRTYRNNNNIRRTIEVIISKRQYSFIWTLALSPFFRLFCLWRFHISLS